MLFSAELAHLTAHPLPRVRAWALSKAFHTGAVWLPILVSILSHAQLTFCSGLSRALHRQGSATNTLTPAVASSAAEGGRSD